MCLATSNNLLLVLQDARKRARFSTDPAMEAPSEGSSLTDEDNDSVQRDQIDKEIRKLRAEMLAASTDAPGASTHVK